MQNSVVIFGSSRSRGDTWNLAQKFIDNVEDSSIIDLAKLDISQFDYEHRNIGDDFIPTMEHVVLTRDTIVLATPVYWYTMSAQMKIFIDRFSDLVSVRKDIGRRLKGKRLYILAAFASTIPEGFELAFKQTCDYLDMKYCGCFYYYFGKKDQKFLQMNEEFINFCASVERGDILPIK